MRKTISARFIFVVLLFPFTLSSCAHTPTQVFLDSDKDGVPDNFDYRYDFTTSQYYDKCPNTPAGVKVDLWGCPLDADKDGVPDYLDKCPDTSAGVKVDGDGCPLDTSRSSVNDGRYKRVIAAGKAVPKTSVGIVRTPKTRFVLLPDPDGKVGEIEVSTSLGSQKLDKPWDSTEVVSPDRIPGKPEVMDEREVRDIFKDALEAQPKPSVVFTIHFRSGSTQPTGQSLRLIPEILDAIKSRKTNHVQVIGHTDTVASSEYNRNLSRLRAKSVAEILISKGVDRTILEIEFYGEEKLFVETPDDVTEPRNRRVEIIVR